MNGGVDFVAWGHVVVFIMRSCPFVCENMVFNHETLVDTFNGFLLPSSVLVTNTYASPLVLIALVSRFRKSIP